MTNDNQAHIELLQNHQRFLSFLRSKVGTAEAAEELLQQAYVKALEKAESLRDGERVVAWFYRVLRNTLYDYYRRRGVEAKALEQFANESPTGSEDRAMEKAVCKCVGHVIDTLKPEYSDVLKKAELQDESLQNIAKSSGMTQGNVAVRLHRARESLKKSLLQTCGNCAAQGCLDCNCRQP